MHIYHILLRLSVVNVWAGNTAPLETLQLEPYNRMLAAEVSGVVKVLIRSHVAAAPSPLEV